MTSPSNADIKTAFHPKNSTSELDRAVSDLGEELHSQYLLTYVPDKAVQSEAGYHNIVVQVLRPDMKIRARDGYYWAGDGKVPEKKK